MTIAAGILAAACVALLAQAGKQGGNRGKMNINIQTEMLAPMFLCGETVQFRLTIVNRGSETVQVPDPLLHELDPEYVVTGPHGKATRVSLGHGRIKGAITDPMAPPVRATMELAPGAKWSELIPLDPMLLLTEPGNYRLRVAYLQGGERKESGEMPFTMERPRAVRFDVAPQGSMAEGARLLTPWVGVDSDGQAHAVDAIRLGKQWGDDRRGKLYANRVLRTRTDGPVTQVAAAASFRAPGMDFSHWLVWAEGRRVRALATRAGEATGEPVALWEGSEGMILVKPAVTDSRHTLSAYIAEASGGGVLVRTDAGAAVKTQRTELPVAPEWTAAVHFEEQGREHSLIAVVGRADARGRRSIVVVDGRDEAPRAIPVAQVDDLRWLPGQPVSLRRERGEIRLNWVGWTGQNDRLVVYALRLSAEGRPLSEPAAADLDPVLGRPEWGSLAGTMLLWRDKGGGLYYQNAGARPVVVKSEFETEPAPVLIVSDGQAFIAGVKRGAGFGMQPLPVRQLQAAPILGR